MSEKIDVLIAYADKDNENLQNDSSSRGWIDNFKHYLEMMLTQVIGEQPNIVTKSDKQPLEAKISSVSTFVAVLSQDFLGSDQCLEAVAEFEQIIDPQGPQRIFKILKTPLNLAEQPVTVRQSTGYNFFHTDLETGEKFALAEYFGPEAEREFWMKLVDLSYDINTTLTQLRKRKSTRKKDPTRGIYLAETGADLAVQRNIMKRELEKHGYDVYPRFPLPSNSQELEEMVEGDINQCKMSIHLIGSAYGEIPIGSDRSVVDLQNRIAAARSIKARKDPDDDFSRFIWITPQLNHATEQQRNFVENLQRDLAATEGAEVMQTALEDFKNIVREELIANRLDRVYKLPQNKFGDEGKVVYLIYDKVDQQTANKIKTTLKRSGYQVLTPSFEDNLIGFQHQHIENLKMFDLALILKGQVNEQWVKMKLLDVLKAPGFGRKKAIDGQAILVEPKSTINKEVFTRYEMEFVEGKTAKEFNASLNFFLEGLKP